MWRIGLFSKLKSTLAGTAAIALLSFSFLAIALPVHAFDHSLRNVVAHVSGHSQILEADCDVCGFATQPAAPFSPSTLFTAIEPVSTRSEPRPEKARALPLALLPPVRGPPTVA